MKKPTVKMVSKLLLALLVAYSSNLASTHIVTSAHLERSFLNCVNSLTNMVHGTLCPMYGQIEYSMERMLNPDIDRSETERSWEFRKNIKICCSRPCTISELISMC